jgi:hypothetical protein
MEEFYKSLRSDLGISNHGLVVGDFAYLILRHGELFTRLAKTNPTMKLAELATLEKALEESVAAAGNSLPKPSGLVE